MKNQKISKKAKNNVIGLIIEKFLIIEKKSNKILGFHLFRK